MRGTGKLIYRLILPAVLFAGHRAAAGEADIQLPLARPGGLFPRLGHEPGDLVFRAVCLRRGRRLWALGILPHPRPAGPPLPWPRFRTSSGRPAKPTCWQQGKFLAALWVLIAAVHDFLFFRSCRPSRCPGARHSGLLHFRHLGQLWRGLVWHPHQHPGQFPRLLCGAAGQPAENAVHPACRPA